MEFSFKKFCKIGFIIEIQYFLENLNSRIRRICEISFSKSIYSTIRQKDEYTDRKIDR